MDNPESQATLGTQDAEKTLPQKTKNISNRDPCPHGEHRFSGPRPVKLCSDQNIISPFYVPGTYGVVTYVRHSVILK